jgi:hypothetical protein
LIFWFLFIVHVENESSETMRHIADNNVKKEFQTTFVTG